MLSSIVGIHCVSGGKGEVDMDLQPLIWGQRDVTMS